MKTRINLVFRTICLTLIFVIVVGSVPVMASDPEFEDVPAWCYEAVEYVWFRDLMDYVAEGIGVYVKFGYGQGTERKEIVDILYRLEGEPEVEGGRLFSDVNPGADYANAVNWASKNGIVSGYPDGSFEPNGIVKREHLVMMLYNYADYKGYDMSHRADLSGYEDAWEVSTYAEDAMAWAVASGLIEGNNVNRLSPDGDAGREQVAMIIMRFCENIMQLS